MDSRAEIASEVANLRPRLSDRQRVTVDGIVDGFLTAGDSGARLALRYLRTVADHPERIGFDPSVRYCGCDTGFRIVESTGSTLTVERCRICAEADR